MFRHKGKNRTYKHNMLLAALLSANAGLVNVTGVLSISTLTTNVTGHFAYFAEELTQGQYILAFTFLLYILSFLLGSFFSSLLTEFYENKGKRNSYVLPIAIEISILLFVGYYLYGNYNFLSAHIIACILLFSMGMQNSLVTQISDSTVRTTHLTGLFTDLGIELSQLFFHSDRNDKNKLFKNIKLRLTIIGFFLMGGIIGGYLFSYIQEATLILASVLLFIALMYDSFIMNYFKLKKQFRTSKKISAILIFLITMLLSTNSFAQFNKSTFTPSKQDIPFKLIIGELKGMPGVYDAYYKLLQQQSTEFKYDLILERDASFCFFVNLHISGTDTNALKFIRFGNAEEKDFYQKILELNKQRELKNKIKTRSFDIEHHNNFQTCLNAIYYMISAVSNASIQATADTIYKNANKPNFIKAKDLIRLIDTTRLSYLMTHDSVLQIIKSNLNSSVSFGKTYTKSWYKQREKTLMPLFSKCIFNIDRYCVIVQTLHLPKSGNNKSFLNKIKIEELGAQYIYPIYFNRFTNNIYKKSYYCLHPKDPFKYNRKSTLDFSKKKGAWLISNKKTYYLVVSN